MKYGQAEFRKMDKRNLAPSRVVVLWIFLLAMFVSHSVGQEANHLPYEEKFSDFLKGSWRGRDGLKTWSSGPLQVRGSEKLVISFDVNRRGSPSDSDSEHEEYLKVYYEVNGAVDGDPLFHGVGKFKGEVVRRVISADDGVLEVKIEARSNSKDVQYFVDNLRIEEPSLGGVFDAYLPGAYEPPPQPAIAPEESGLVQYGTTPRFKPSSTYSLRVNGVPVFVEESWGDLGVVIDPDAHDYKLAVARMAFDFSKNSIATIEVTANEKLSQYTISPQNPSVFGMDEDAYYSNIELADNRIRFDVKSPRQIFLELNELEYLVILIDPIEENQPQIGDENVINLNDYLAADRDRNEDVTAQVQQALDDASAGRKTLFVPDDLYMTGQLVIKSDTHLYLSSGAMIQAIPEWNRSLWPGQAGANVTNEDSSFIFVGDNSVSMDRLEETKVENVHISGRGVIDGNGWNMRYYNDSSLKVANVKLFRSANVRNLLVEDVYFRDSARWSFNVLLTQDVRFSNVKLINCMVGYWGDWENSKHFPNEDGTESKLFHIPLVTNLDGFDIDAVGNGVFEDCFVFTGDDAFTPKVTGYMDLIAPCSNLVIRNNVIWTEKVALKVGPEDYDDMYNIVFEDNSIIRADRLFTVLIEGKDGVSSSNIQLLDNRVEEIGGNFYERFFRFYVSHPGSISNIEVDGVYALSNAPQFSSSNGFDEFNRVSNVSIRNVRVGGETLAFEDLFLKDENEHSYPQIQNSSIRVNDVLYESQDQ